MYIYIYIWYCMSLGIYIQAFKCMCTYSRALFQFRSEILYRNVCRLMHQFLHIYIQVFPYSCPASHNKFSKLLISTHTYLCANISAHAYVIHMYLYMHIYELKLHWTSSIPRFYTRRSMYCSCLSIYTHMYVYVNNHSSARMKAPCHAPSNILHTHSYICRCILLWVCINVNMYSHAFLRIEALPHFFTFRNHVRAYTCTSKHCICLRTYMRTHFRWMY